MTEPSNNDLATFLTTMANSHAAKAREVGPYYTHGHEVEMRKVAHLRLAARRLMEGQSNG